MDVNDLRIAVTVLSLLAFLGVLIWAFRARNRKRFEEAAQLPFAEADAEDRREGSS
ncbi:MAG: cbb3-type cytochrome oxidase subunit 3 [Caldimonas sp.]